MRPCRKQLSVLTIQKTYADSADLRADWNRELVQPLRQWYNQDKAAAGHIRKGFACMGGFTMIKYNVAPAQCSLACYPADDDREEPDLDDAAEWFGKAAGQRTFIPTPPRVLEATEAKFVS